LLRIPNDRQIAELYSNGIPFVLEIPVWKKRFQSMLALILRNVEREVIIK
jgi:hypothetical protein